MQLSIIGINQASIHQSSVTPLTEEETEETRGHNIYGASRAMPTRLHIQSHVWALFTWEQGRCYSMAHIKGGQFKVI